MVQQWLWSGQLRIAAELLAAQYIYGNKANVPELILQGGKTYRVITDHLGSPVMVVNIEDATDVLFEARYDAWGNRTVLIGDEDSVPFGFAGGMVDADTGLVRFGARDYDPVTGRWTGKESLRFEKGRNFFVYTSDDPVNMIDITGKAPTKPYPGQMAACLLCRGTTAAVSFACGTFKNPICLVGTIPCSVACSFVCQGLDRDLLTGGPPSSSPAPGPQTGAEGTSSQGTTGGSSGGSGGSGTQ